MRKRVKLLAYFTLYWLAFMIVIRATFLVYNHDLTHQLTASEIFLVFLYGLKMDASMGGYMLMFTSLMLTISVFKIRNLSFTSLIQLASSFYFYRVPLW